MKKIIVFILGITFTYYVSAQSTSDKLGPIIKFEKTIHDFGELEVNFHATTKFKFTNEGDVPLVLQKVQKSCGCTTPVYSQKPVMPGESEYITVGFNTHSYAGRSFSKQITVITNAKDNSDSKLIMLTIKGTVKKAPVKQLPVQSPVRVSPN